MINILVLFDEKQSSKNQCEALTSEIRKLKKTSIDFIKIKKKKFHYFPNILIFLFLKLFFKNNQSFNKNYDLIISCGRVTAPYNLIYKNSFNIKNIHILDPYIFRDCFTRIIIPEHDKIKFTKTRNTIFTLGTLVKKALKNKKKIIRGKKKIITFLIGGSGKSSELLLSEIKEVLKKLDKVNEVNQNFNIIHCFSRRTPESIRKYLIHNDYDYYPKGKNNPYNDILESSDYFIVTEDSVSMISDALTTGKPTFIMPVKRIKKKIRTFSSNLIRLGYLKRFEGLVVDYNYKPLNEAERVAMKIVKEF